jgi:hypothetical protein
MTRTTHPSLSALVWTCSLVLQSALFISLFSRRISNRFPFFTNLIGFYLVRSALLYLIFGFISASAYSGLYRGLLLLDLLVQACAAIEITSALIRELDGRTSSRTFIPLAFLCVAAIGTAVIVGILPHSRIPIDRGQPFFAFLLIFLCGWAIFIPTSSQLVRGITQGLAFYALISLVATIGRALASAHNHSGRYATWSYTLAGAYLVVIIFWLLTLNCRHTAGQGEASKSSGDSHIERNRGVRGSRA